MRNCDLLPIHELREIDKRFRYHQQKHLFLPNGKEYLEFGIKYYTAKFQFRKFCSKFFGRLFVLSSFRFSSFSFFFFFFSLKNSCISLEILLISANCESNFVVFLRSSSNWLKLHLPISNCLKFLFKTSKTRSFHPRKKTYLNILFGFELRFESEIKLKF